jgi:hypothetical protein
MQRKDIFCGLINSFIPSFYEAFSSDEVYTCCPLEMQKAPLRGKDVGTVSFSFRPYARTTREFKWDGDTHMSGDALKAFMLPMNKGKYEQA